MPFAKTCATAVALALSCSLSAQAQVAGGGTDGRSDDPEKAGVCTHTGADQNPQHSYDSGVYLCSAGLKLLVNYAGMGVVVEMTPGCPSSVTTIPAYGKKVQRLHHNAVKNGQVEGYSQDFHCEGAWFWKQCVPSGSKSPNGILRDDYQEHACDSLL